MRPYIQTKRGSFIPSIPALCLTAIASVLAGMFWYLDVAFLLGSSTASGTPARIYWYQAILAVFIGFFVALFLALFTKGVIKKFKIRHPSIASLLGVLAGIIIVVSVNYFLYLRFQDQIQTLGEQTYNLDKEETARRTSEYLRIETGTAGVIGYLLLSAREPITWIGWVVQLGLASSIFLIVRDTTDTPFDEKCGEWFRNSSLLGSVSWEKREELIDLLKGGDFENAGKFISHETFTKPYLDVEMSLSKPEGDVLLILREITSGTKYASKQHWLISPSELNNLRRYIASELETNPDEETEQQ